MYFIVLSFLFFFKYSQCANILCVFPYPAPSHQSVFQPLWRRLSLKGHKVTVVTPIPLNDPSLTNLTEISVQEGLEVLEKNKLQDFASKDANVFQTFIFSLRFLDSVVESELDTKGFRELIDDKNKTFDLILVECFFPVLHMLSERFGAPVVTVSSLAALTAHYDIIGSPNHPVLYPDLFLNSPAEETLFWQRIRNVLFGVWSVFYHLCCLVPRTNTMAKRYFGDHIPYLGNVEKNLSMTFLNENLLLYPLRPHVPGVIQMGQMHLKSAKLLPKDLEKILDEAKKGVVYFSLGSGVKSIDIKENLKQIITQALSELPYKVIWKWESDYLPNKPPNVIIKKWLPQQDLLAHPNVRVFVTQGGMQSTEEAISRGIPMVGLPFTHDQPTNMQKMANLGIGITLDPSTVTKDELKNAIIEVAENNCYKKQIKKARNILLDKYTKGVENAIWWSEYVVRHKGAKHLKSPSADISWVDYLMLDLFCICVTTLIVIAYGSYKIAKFTTYDKPI